MLKYLSNYIEILTWLHFISKSYYAYNFNYLFQKNSKLFVYNE